MKICFCSLLLPDAEKLMSKTKSKLSFSRHKFGLSVLEGLEANAPGDVYDYNIINTVNFPAYKQLFFKTEHWSHRTGADDLHIGYVNLFVVKYVTQYWKLKRALKKFIKANKNEKCVLYVQDMYFPSVCAALDAAKGHPNVKTCLMTGDLNGKFGLKPDSNSLKNRLSVYKDRYINKRVREFDSFVLVTKYMAEAMGVSDKPHTVMECIFSQSNASLQEIDNCENPSGEKMVFYAGALREEYGILHLLRAFSLIEDENFRLVIAGGGDAEEAIREYAEKDPRIRFLGFISPAEVEKYQNEATLLVNPRTSEHEFVKYSFASKNMDCLASGKPYVAHKLPCNPPEYDSYILYPDSESDQDLAKRIQEVAALPKAEKDEIAQKARDFILTDKTPAGGCGKIIEMLRELCR